MLNDNNRRAGEELLLFGLWLWMTVTIGPWWVGALLMLVSWALNIVLYCRRTGKRPWD